MQFLHDTLVELTRLLIGLAFVAALVWICGHMPRAYVALKIFALATWGTMSIGIPAFVFVAIYIPSRQYLMGLIAVAVGAVCMLWPFMAFGWPALRDAIRPGATHRP